MRVIIKVNYEAWLSEMYKKKQFSIYQIFIWRGVNVVRCLSVPSRRVSQLAYTKDLAKVKSRIERATRKAPVKLNQTILYHTL